MALWLEFINLYRGLGFRIRFRVSYSWLFVVSVVAVLKARDSDALNPAKPDGSMQKGRGARKQTKVATP